MFFRIGFLCDHGAMPRDGATIFGDLEGKLSAWDRMRDVYPAPVNTGSHD